MDKSESVAQPTPGTSSGTDSATIPPVLTEQDIPGAALNEPLDQHTMPELIKRFSLTGGIYACARSGLTHRLALGHEYGRSI